MKNGYTLYQHADTPEAEALFAKAEALFGFVPNLFRSLAQAPATGHALATLYPMAGDTSFSPNEQQVVYQASNVVNGCHYCVPAHTVTSRAAGMPEADIQKLRNGEPLDDPKLEALRTFSVKMTRDRGVVSEAEFKAFLEAGWTRQNALEVVLLIAIKTITNYANHLTGVSLDEKFAAEAWEPATTTV